MKTGVLNKTKPVAALRKKTILVPRIFRNYNQLLFLYRKTSLNELF